LFKFFFYFLIIFSFWAHDIQADNLTYWQRSAGNDNSNKHANLDQINKNNINSLKIAWVFHSGIKSNSEVTPIFNNGYIFTTSKNSIFAVNPYNGKKIWETKLNLNEIVSRRGLVCYKNKIFITSSNGIYSIDSADGKILSKYGSELSQIPPVFKSDQMYVANNTSIESWNLITGIKAWTFSLRKDNVTARIWSGFTFDKKNNILFAVTSDTGFIYDADIKNGGFSNSILAIDASTGSLIWQFQEIKHDLWDLDIVGHPIIADITINDKLIPTIIAVSKSGNILFLNRINGKLIYSPDKISIPKYDNESKYASENQLIIKNPVPFSSNNFDLINDITNLSDDKKKYVQFKLRHALSKPFLPASKKYDVVYYGLHGGAEWPGAALDPNTSTLFISSNKYPWILRAQEYVKDEKKILSLSRKSVTYFNKCAACHGNDMRGAYLKESDGDLYFPSLVNVTKRIEREKLLSLSEFQYNHHYISEINPDKSDSKALKNLKLIFEKVNNDKKYENYLKRIIPTKIQKILSKSAISSKFLHGDEIDYSKLNLGKLINSVTNEDLENIYSLFNKVQEEIQTSDDYDVQAFWQLVLDQDGLPGSNPPWGFITAIDLKSGKLKWKKPFGIVYDKKNRKTYYGDMNFGGLMTTSSGLVFANGTRDSYARAYNSENGEELWKYKLPAAGSAPPMSYMAKGCQFIVFTATGGNFVGYEDSSDSTIALKLNECK